MEKVLILNGSPRGDGGNTAIIVDHFMTGYLEHRKSVHVDRIVLKSKQIKPCMGCFACWKHTPGECIHDDDMKEILDLFIKADTVIWASPLYHHGMTKLLKNFVERTLPLSQPYIVKHQGKFVHPQRWDLSQQKNVLVSNCGFPEHDNFKIMTQTFNRLVKGGLDGTIYCVMGELLNKQAMRPSIQWYLDGVENAGRDIAQDSRISPPIQALLSKPLVAIDTFIEMANLSWKAEGEVIPSLDEAMAEKSGGDVENCDHGKAWSQMKLMDLTFNPCNAKDLELVLEIEFSDLKENYTFYIKDQKCCLKEEKSQNYTTKIFTPFDTWMAISKGEIEGAQAMVDGLYKIDGDMGLLMKMRHLFGGESLDTSLKSKNSVSRIMGIRPSKWMTITFIPWIISWIFIGSSAFMGLALPLLLMLAIVSIKTKHRACTYFENISGMYFSGLGLAYILGFNMIGPQGPILNYLSMALIWLNSLVKGQSLTSDYSKHDLDDSMATNIIFEKINTHLTLLWACIFMVQGGLYSILDKHDLSMWSPGLYGLTLMALVITKWYVNWYPKKIVSR